MEIYINYDCDRAALDNIYERLMNIVSKIGQTHFAPPSKEEQAQSGSSKQASGSGSGPAIPPSLATSALSGKDGVDAPHYAGLPPEIKLRRQALECLVAALRSMVAWSSMVSPARAQEAVSEGPSRASEDGLGRHHASSSTTGSTSHIDHLPITTPSWPTESHAYIRSPAIGISANGLATPDVGDDDVGRFESAKQRKTTLQEGIKKFNFKPKRGIEYLLEHGFISSKAPPDIARFLMGHDGLSKAMIGEYLGEA